jgi:hypothetical protein
MMSCDQAFRLDPVPLSVGSARPACRPPEWIAGRLAPNSRFTVSLGWLAVDVCCGRWAARGSAESRRRR